MPKMEAYFRNDHIMAYANHAKRPEAKWDTALQPAPPATASSLRNMRCSLVAFEN